MAPIIDYQGQAIRLAEERWQHISEHPEMTGIGSAVEDTLRSPEVVVQSLSDPRARLYYRYYHGTMVGDKYVCVVVVRTHDDAFVVTAYLTDRVKKGKALWRKEP
jgi:hypothetical protein